MFGLIKDSFYFESFGFILSLQLIQIDVVILCCFGYVNVYEMIQVLDWLSWWILVENVDGLLVGFVCLIGVVNFVIGWCEEDKIGLICVVCYIGQIYYQGVDICFDGGLVMMDLKKFEFVIGLLIVYMFYVLFCFDCFVDCVFGFDFSKMDCVVFKQKFGVIGFFLIDWV